MKHYLQFRHVLLDNEIVPAILRTCLVVSTSKLTSTIVSSRHQQHTRTSDGFGCVMLHAASRKTFIGSSNTLPCDQVYVGYVWPAAVTHGYAL